MYSTRSFRLVKLLALGLVPACFSATPVRAQNAFNGKFALPFEARWGQAVLPPGDYTFTLASAGSPQIITVYRGDRGVAMVMASTFSQRPLSTNSALLVVRSGETYRIRSLHLAELGLVLHYAPRKGEAPLLARAPEPVQRVPISLAGR